MSPVRAVCELRDVACPQELKTRVRGESRTSRHDPTPQLHRAPVSNQYMHRIRCRGVCPGSPVFDTGGSAASRDTQRR